jgi:rhodanese-related sulfurtransferase
MLEGRVEAFQWHEVENLRETGPYILDVREPKEWKAGHIEEAMHIPLDRLRDSLLELPLAETIFVYCHAGLRGDLATRILQENRFDMKNLDGGYKTYSAPISERRQLKHLIPEPVV